MDFYFGNNNIIQRIIKFLEQKMGVYRARVENLNIYSNYVYPEPNADHNLNVFLIVVMIKEKVLLVFIIFYFLFQETFNVN